MASKLRVDHIEPTNGIPTDGGGGIIQVKQALKTDTSTTTSATASDISGLSVSITPHFLSSKLWIVGRVNLGTDFDTCANIHLVANSTEIGKPTSYGSRAAGHTGRGYRIGNSQYYDSWDCSIDFLYSPSSTSAQTIKVQWSQTDTDGVTMYCNRSESDNDAAWAGRYTSTLTVLEVSG